MPPVHVIVITHTPARLRRTLLGVPAGSLKPASLTLACDADDPEIEAVARRATADSGFPLTLVRRPSTGRARLAQTRNNAVRALMQRESHNRPDPASVLVFLDGDVIPGPDTLARHHDRLTDPKRPRQLSLGWRVDMNPEQDALFTDEAVLAASPPEITPDQRRAIDQRHLRYLRQAFWARLGLARPHKPKILGANFACPLATYLAVNGQDEEFEGWGQEDDDFARRVYQSGGRPHIGLRDTLVYHQHHETLAPPEWKAGSNVALLQSKRPTRCAHGIENPVEQPAVKVLEIA